MTKEDDDILMNEITSMDDGNILLIAQSNQEMAQVDIRSDKYAPLCQFVIVISHFPSQQIKQHRMFTVSSVLKSYLMS